MRKFSIVALVFVLMVVCIDVAYAQCAMCKAAIESSDEGEGTIKGVKQGIAYLMLFPYIGIGAVAFFWYRNYKRNQNKQYH